MKTELQEGPVHTLCASNRESHALIIYQAFDELCNVEGDESLARQDYNVLVGNYVWREGVN